MWHGRHHSAQKSTNTGCVLLAEITSASKFPSFTVWMLLSAMVCSQAALGGSSPPPPLDDAAAVWLRPACAASYSFSYSAAEAFHEKSFAMPFCWMRRQVCSSA